MLIVNLLYRCSKASNFLLDIHRSKRSGHKSLVGAPGTVSTMVLPIVRPTRSRLGWMFDEYFTGSC